MADAIRLSRDDVRALARAAAVDLPNDRLNQLVTTLSAYLDNLDRLRRIDPGNAEPPAITYESEARA